MGMNGFLCTVSPARRRHLEEDPDLVHDLASEDVPGLLRLEATWDALDLLLSNRGEDDLLGDVILARHGRPIGTPGTYGKAMILTPERVRAVAEALMRLPAGLVRDRYKSLARAKPPAHGGFGENEDNEDEDVEELSRRLKQVTELFVTAAKAGHGMLAMVV